LDAISLSRNGNGRKKNVKNANFTPMLVNPERL